MGNGHVTRPLRSIAMRNAKLSCLLPQIILPAVIGVNMPHFTEDAELLSFTSGNILLYVLG